MKKIIFGLVIWSFAFPAFAERSPHIGQETREIKALSESEIEKYLTGKGMGQAKTAELNHYPGPRHVLDLANQLDLTQEQKKETLGLFNSMKAKASSLGKKLVDKEIELDRLFKNSLIDSNTLKDLLSDIGMLKQKIRFAHMNAHLKQRALLSMHQIKQYDQLRGYGTSPGSGHNHSH